MLGCVFVCLFVCLIDCLLVCLFVCVLVCLFVCLLVCLSVALFILMRASRSSDKAENLFVAVYIIYILFGVYVLMSTIRRIVTSLENSTTGLASSQFGNEK